MLVLIDFNFRCKIFMMKKHISSLLLSAAMLTTNPLFAMDPPSHEEVDHSGSTLKPQVNYQDEEVTSAQLKSMRNYPCDPANVQPRESLPFNIASYSFSIEGKVYELHVYSPKYRLPPECATLLEYAKSLESSVLQKSDALLEYAKNMKEFDRLNGLAFLEYAKALKSLNLQEYANKWENTSPEEYLEALIEKGENVTFTSEAPFMNKLWDSRCKLPIALYSWQDGFHMILRTK
jgi:hypothetical protein